METYILQHALSGHGLSEPRFVPAAGRAVPGTCGPQTVPATGAGIGEVPVLRQMAWPACSLLQPPHPQVRVLRASRSETVMLLLSAMAEHNSPATTTYDAQEPSAFWPGTGSQPEEQQTFWPTASVEHRVGLGLYE